MLRGVSHLAVRRLEDELRELARDRGGVRVAAEVLCREKPLARDVELHLRGADARLGLGKRVLHGSRAPLRGTELVHQLCRPLLGLVGAVVRCLAALFELADVRSGLAELLLGLGERLLRLARASLRRTGALLRLLRRALRLADAVVGLVRLLLALAPERGELLDALLGLAPAVLELRDHLRRLAELVLG